MPSTSAGDARPLDQVRGEIVERLRALRATTEARTRGEAIVQQVRLARTCRRSLSAAGLKLSDAGPLTRRSAAVPPDLLAAVFRAPTPNRTASRSCQGVGLDERRLRGVPAAFVVLPASPSGIPQEQRDQRKRSLAQRVAAGETEALAAQLA